MNIFIYLLLAAVFSVDYLSETLGIGGRIIVVLPELLSLIAMAVVIYRLVVYKQISVRIAYFVFMLFLITHILSGIVLNSVPSGAVIGGIRTYFRYLPFFLLPAVYIFTEKDLLSQLKFILVLLCLQLPLSLYQRFYQFKGANTGDVISGTLMISSHLSILLICGIAVAFSFYLKNRLSLAMLFILMILLFLPTTINETKGSLILLPIAFIVPVLLSGGRHRNFYKLIVGLALTAVLTAGFVKIYNQSYGQSRERSITEFIEQGKVKDYLLKGASGNPVANEDIGKLDSITLALDVLSKDWTKLWFGLGIGNVGKSFSDVIEGAYSRRYAHMQPETTSVSFLIWETGLFGVTLVLIGCLLIMRDALSLSQSQGQLTALGIGWVAVVIIYLTSLWYKNIVTPSSIGYIFWFISGCVAAEAARKRVRPRV